MFENPKNIFLNAIFFLVTVTRVLHYFSYGYIQKKEIILIFRFDYSISECHISRSVSFCVLKARFSDPSVRVLFGFCFHVTVFLHLHYSCNSRRTNIYFSKNVLVFPAFVLATKTNFRITTKTKVKLFN